MARCPGSGDGKRAILRTLPEPSSGGQGGSGGGRKALVEGIRRLVEHKTLVEQKTLVEGNASPHRHRWVGPPVRLLDAEA